MPPIPLPPRGRLSAERENEIYRAVIGELADVGFERLNFDHVAERAQCSKATLYRLWDGKLDLVVSALRCHADDKKQGAALVDTGTLRGDLHAVVDLLVGDQTPSTALILGLARACHDRPELAAALCERIDRDEDSTFQALIARAVARGEIPADPPAGRFLLLALAGPSLLHDIFAGVPATAATLREYIDAVVLPALGAPRHDA